MSRVFLVDLQKGAAVEPPWLEKDTAAIEVTGKPEEKVGAAAAIPALHALRAKAKVKLCAIAPEVKIARSKTADPEQRARALALVKDLQPEDRATILAAALNDEHICKIDETLEAIARVAPSEKEVVLARSVGDQLEACGCPRRGAETAFAFVTLILDTWNYAADCVTVEPTDDAAAPVVVVAQLGTYGELLKALREHDCKPVRLELAKP